MLLPSEVCVCITASVLSCVGVCLPDPSCCCCCCRVCFFGFVSIQQVSYSFLV